jgi:uncharacterized membrane protein YhhN
MELKSLLTVISLAVVLSAGVTIAAHYLRPLRPILIYVFKPLTTILILAVAIAPGAFLTDPYVAAIVLGLVFSLLGDILLVLPRDRFVFGLVSFLLAHLCYIFAFLVNFPSPSFLWSVLPLSIFGAIVLRYLWPALSAGLKGAVSLYIAVIVVMVTLASGRAFSRFSPDTLSAAVGALLFLTSDVILAIDRFRRPFRLSSAAVLASYFAGQLLIALSIGLLAYRVT